MHLLGRGGDVTWTVATLAAHLGLTPGSVRAKLSRAGIRAASRRSLGWHGTTPAQYAEADLIRAGILSWR